MAQFDVFVNHNPKSQDRVPFLLDVQHSIVDELASRLVIPLVREQGFSKLNPKVRIDNQILYLSTQEMASIPVSHLDEKVGSLTENREDILGAIDFLLVGF